MLKFKKEWHRDLFFGMMVLTFVHLFIVVGVM